jgi:hypothetical protein
VRQAAAEALGQIGDPQATPALIQALQDEDWECAGRRRGAVETPARLAASERARTPRLAKAHNFHPASGAAGERIRAACRRPGAAGGVGGGPFALAGPAAAAPRPGLAGLGPAGRRGRAGPAHRRPGGAGDGGALRDRRTAGGGRPRLRSAAAPLGGGVADPHNRDRRSRCWTGSGRPCGKRRRAGKTGRATPPHRAQHRARGQRRGALAMAERKAPGPQRKEEGAPGDSPSCARAHLQDGGGSRCLATRNAITGGPSACRDTMTPNPALLSSPSSPTTGCRGCVPKS